jgi:arylsulfatase A-like enzyme
MTIKESGRVLPHPSACLPHDTSMMSQNHLEEGFVTRINLSDSRWSENTINTHKYNNIYWSLNRSYYNLGLCISYIEEVWSQNYALGDKSEFAEVISLNGHYILFALKENAIHRCSKPEDPSIESNPHRFGLPTDNPHQHCRQEEAVPHLHTESSKSKAWATTLSKTYPRWPKDHL